VRGIAAKDYPREVIEGWAPMPVTDDAVDRVSANIENEYRLVPEIEGRVVGIRAAVFEIAELRACYVTPDAGRKDVGAALVNRAGYEVVEPGEHVLRNGQRMARVKMRKDLGT
jgi:putative acetyltransferase